MTELDGPPSRDEVVDDQDECNDQEQVYEAPGDPGDESQQPEDDDDHDDQPDDVRQRHAAPLYVPPRDTRTPPARRHAWAVPRLIASVLARVGPLEQPGHGVGQLVEAVDDR